MRFVRGDEGSQPWEPKGVKRRAHGIVVSIADRSHRDGRTPASRQRRGQTGNVIYGVGACYSRYAGRVVTSYPAKISGFGAWRDQPASLTLMSSPSEARSSASGSTSMSFA